MLQLNKKDKIRSFLVVICILFSVSLFSQSEKTSEKSSIVMTQSELTSFLSSRADARRAVLNKRDSVQQKKYLAELRLKHQNRAETRNGAYDNASSQQILQELRYLNQRIDNLSTNNTTLPTSRDNSTIIMSSNTTPGSLNQPIERSTVTVIPSNNKLIKELESRIDSLKNAESKNAESKNAESNIANNSLKIANDSLKIANNNLKTENDSLKIADDSLNIADDSLNIMKGNLVDVRRQLDSLESKFIANNKLTKTEDTRGEKTYFKQQVYFDNNSETMKAEFYPNVQDLTQILIDYPEAKVLLEGWASPVGKVDYNKALSMRRAEAVEQAFLNNRIDKTRILTSFRGEDKTSSEANARRVDMSIIVR